MHPGLVPYIIKRLLLMIPTLLGVLTLTFIVVQFVPGGPVEQMVLELKGGGAAGIGSGESSGAGSNYRGRQGIEEKNEARQRNAHILEKKGYFFALTRGGA